VTALASPLWLAVADGNRRLRYVDLVYQPLKREDGAVFGILVQGSDVTERVEAEAALRESEVEAEQGLAPFSNASDLLITDVQLPGMSGDLLAALARTLAPGIRIVFATGKGEVDNWPDAVVLRKPYDLKALMGVQGTAVAD
jgi:CheY-like chemotaxis protein